MNSNERGNALAEDCKAINGLINDIALTMQRATDYLRTLADMTMPTQQFQGDQVYNEQFGMDNTDWGISASGADLPPSKLLVTKKTDVDDSAAFRVVINIPEFSSEETHVSVLDNYVVVKCSHRERNDENGLVSRQFIRRYLLPPGVQNSDVTSHVNENHALTVEAKKKKTTGVSKKDGEYQVPIQFRPSTEVQKDPESSSDGMQTDTPSVESVLTPDTPSTE